MDISEKIEKTVPNYHHCRIEGDIEYRTATFRKNKSSDYLKLLGWQILKVSKRRKIVGERQVVHTVRDKWGYKKYDTDGGGNLHTREESHVEYIYSDFWDYELCRNLNDPQIIRFSALDKEELYVCNLINNFKNSKKEYENQQSKKKKIFYNSYPKLEKLSPIFVWLRLILLILGILLSFNGIGCIITHTFGSFGVRLLSVGAIFIIIPLLCTKLIKIKTVHLLKEECKELNINYYSKKDIIGLRKKLNVRYKQYLVLRKNTMKLQQRL